MRHHTLGELVAQTLLAAAFLFAPSAASCQDMTGVLDTLTIFGRVTEEPGGRPVYAFVGAAALGAPPMPEARTWTDSAGFYRLRVRARRDAPRAYLIAASALGYYREEREIWVLVGRTDAAGRPQDTDTLNFYVRQRLAILNPCTPGDTHCSIWTPERPPQAPKKPLR